MFSELNVIRGAFRLGFLRVGADNRAWRGAEPIELPKKSSSIQIVTTWTVPLKFYMLQSSNVDQSSESLHSDKKRPQSGAAFFLLALWFYRRVSLRLAAILEFGLGSTA